MSPTSPPTRIALAGTGAFCMRHFDALASIEDIELAAVVTPYRDEARKVAARYGANPATDLTKVLKRDDIEAVILCTQTPLHAEQAIATMRAGKHVEVEIPRMMDERGIDVTIFSPRASFMAHHIGDFRTCGPGLDYPQERR